MTSTAVIQVNRSNCPMGHRCGDRRTSPVEPPLTIRTAIEGLAWVMKGVHEQLRYKLPDNKGDITRQTGNAAGWEQGNGRTDPQALGRLDRPR